MKSQIKKWVKSDLIKVGVEVEGGHNFILIKSWLWIYLKLIIWRNIS